MIEYAFYICIYLIQVPYLEDGLAVVERVLEEAIASGKGVEVAAEDGAVGEDDGLEEAEVVVADGVADVDGTAGDGAGGGVEGSARVGGLEHVPVRVDEVSHPQAVVGTVDHVASLQPERPVRVTRWVGAPKIITCNIPIFQLLY